MNKYTLLFVLYFNATLAFATDQAITFDGKTTLLNKQNFKYAHFKSDSLFNLESFENVEDKINFGQSNEILYLRFIIKNTSNDENLALSIDNPMLDTITIYRWKNNNSECLGHFTFGNINTRDFYDPTAIALIKLKKFDTDTLFLRIHSSEELILPISIGTEQNTRIQRNFMQNIYWLFAGIIFVMFFYNFFLFYSTKDRLYLYYIIYILSIGLAQLTLSGTTLVSLFAQYPYLYKYAIILFPSLSGVFAVVFLRNFIQTKIYVPKHDKIIQLVLVGYAIAGLLRIFRFDQASSATLDIIALPGTITVYSATIRIVRLKVNSARFFLYAWSIFIVGIFLFVLRNLGVIPYSPITTYGMTIGAGLEAILLSLALANKINTLEREKRQKEEDRIKALEENERLINQQKVTLEISVKERTRELSMTLQKLKETQAQLVENEKLSSLGQLTAGIAHEINNPINFVSANINPLKRDINIIKEILAEIEKIALTNISDSEKADQIQALKNNYDFDYTSQEIEFLLHGISDGADRTIQIVKGLRVFSRVDEDTYKWSDIIEGIESTLIILNNQLSNIKISREFFTDGLIECFPGKLNQVFLNLLTNSIYAIKEKFAAESGGEIKIHVSDNQDYRIIRFSDNGIGISAENQNKIFEPFYTNKPPGEGTGLGLAITYRIIEQHNGKISFTSHENKGTAFTIQIPLNKD